MYDVQTQKGSHMTKVSIIVDLAFEDDISELHDEFAQTEIELKIVTEVGPGGGWPECELTGEESVIRKWLLENYCDEDTADFYMGINA